MKRKILKNNKPVNFSPIEKYKLLLNELQTGVHCPNCTKLPMIRIHAYWYCPYCKTQDKNAHLVALKDYALVVSNTISNKELRDFLQLPSMYVASRMLKDLHLESFGRGKGTRYKLPF